MNFLAVTWRVKSKSYKDDADKEKVKVVKQAGVEAIDKRFDDTSLIESPSVPSSFRTSRRNSGDAYSTAGHEMRFC